MHRTQIYLSADEWGTLKLLSNARNQSVSELIRLAVRRFYVSKRKFDFDAAVKNVAGIWKDKEMDTHQYIRKLRTGLGRGMR